MRRLIPVAGRLIPSSFTAFPDIDCLLGTLWECRRNIENTPRLQLRTLAEWQAYDFGLDQSQKT